MRLRLSSRPSPSTRALDAAARNLEATAKLEFDIVRNRPALRALADEFDASIAAGGIDDLEGILSGIREMTQRYGMFHQGLVDYTDGVKALASNYAQMNAGAHGLAAGAVKLAQGATGLAGGVSQLNAVTVDLPQTMRDQIAAMMADYDFPAFEPRSFASPDNAFTSEVQFVISTPAIEKSDVQVEPSPARARFLGPSARPLLVARRPLSPLRRRRGDDAHRPVASPTLDFGASML